MIFILVLLAGTLTALWIGWMFSAGRRPAEHPSDDALLLRAGPATVVLGFVSLAFGVGLIFLGRAIGLTGWLAYSLVVLVALLFGSFGLFVLLASRLSYTLATAEGVANESRLRGRRAVRWEDVRELRFARGDLDIVGLDGTTVRVSATMRGFTELLERADRMAPEAAHRQLGSRGSARGAS